MPTEYFGTGLAVFGNRDLESTERLCRNIKSAATFLIREFSENRPLGLAVESGQYL